MNSKKLDTQIVSQIFLLFVIFFKSRFSHFKVTLSTKVISSGNSHVTS